MTNGYETGFCRVVLCCSSRLVEFQSRRRDARMSRRGLQVAKDFGKRLPAFGSQADAEAYLFSRRDQLLQRLSELAAASGVFVADFSPASLKNVERFYFTLYETDGFEALGISLEEFEFCMASYFCEVAVRNCPNAKWEVRAFPFQHGKFEIGVGRGLFHIMLTRFTDHYRMPNNKRRQKIYKMYERYFVV